MHLLFIDKYFIAVENELNLPAFELSNFNILRSLYNF